MQKMIQPYLSRIFAVIAAAVAGWLSNTMGLTDALEAETATAVGTALMLGVYALTHKTGSKITNPSDDATPGKTG